MLLDTSTLLWMLMIPERLSEEARTILGDPQNERVVSSISVFEIATKHRLGRLILADPLVPAFDRYLDAVRAERLAVNDEHALMAGSFTHEHRDPFDRMLAAQSLVEGIPMVTNDRAIPSFGVTTIW